MIEDEELNTLRISIKAQISEGQLKELQRYFASMPMEEIIRGLSFIYNRWTAEKGGFLMVGRKSKIKREVHLLTPEQARWRLENWKVMIRNFRERGYSYPTISRIKKSLQEIVRLSK